MKEIGIIIPIYNCEEFLEECFESVINQTIDKSKLEVILVNDGSKDNSYKIIDKYKKENDNWIVINQENQGLSEARNNGIKASNSKYLIFLDSDDTLPLDAVQNLYDKIEKSKSDLVIGGLENYNSKGHNDNYTKKHLKNIDNINYENNPHIFDFVHSAGKIFRYESIKNIHYIPKVKHEDNYFFYAAVLSNLKIDMIDKIVYYHRIREGNNLSITQSLNLSTFKDLIINYDKIIKEFEYSQKFTKVLIKKIYNYIANNIEQSQLREAFIIANSSINKIIKKSNCNKLYKIFLRIDQIFYYIRTKLYKLIRR